MPRRVRVFAHLFVIALSATSSTLVTSALADPPFLTMDEFEVNTYTTGRQQAPAACSDSAGNFVVVWQDGGGSYGDGQDGYLGGIRAQRFDSNANRIGTEFQINEFTEYEQRDPEVACAANGDFVVVWGSGAYAEGPDGYGEGISARRFLSSGAAAGTEFVVNTYTTYYQRQPDVCSAPDGRFVVVWNGQEYKTFARSFDSTGAPEGTEFQVDSGAPGYYSYNPAIACDASRNFVVVWGTDDYYGDVWGRRFDSTSTPLGTAFRVNTYTEGTQGSKLVGYPSPLSVSSTPTGEFVVVWESSGQFNYNTHIVGQRFNADATTNGTEFRVSQNQGFYDYDQIEPTVAIDERGAFMVVWANYSETVRARAYEQSGLPESEEQFTVATGGFYGYIMNPKIAEGPGGRFVTVWSDYDDGANEDFEVLALRFGSPLCGAAPVSGCRTSAAGASQLQIVNSQDDDKDSVKWKWSKGADTPIEALGNPVLGSSRYELCVYDSSLNDQPVLSAGVGPNSGLLGCNFGAKNCWKEAGPMGFKFKSKDGFFSQGVTQVKAKAGTDAKPKMQFKAGSFGVDIPTLPLTGTVTVQLMADSGPAIECWETTYTVTDKNTPEQYKAVGP